ncbi:Vacuolar protein sorting protein vps66 [Coemansia javaensis]|uniref:Vacuolar protein sorting protein vps66 n=1 Tax=Coemansia javaensis TaxID=2761396 RepID=A0A9W8LIV1_9FUNG|nr:Vacuolar protein sorting protein vps66 [Coemansia javaensis]
MEKYSKWRDAGTGIQPFLQPVPARTQQGPVAGALRLAARCVVGPLLAAVRLVALGAVAAADAAAAGVGALLVVPVARRAWSVCTRAVLARVALWVMGFYAIDAKTVGLQRGRRSGGEAGGGGGGGGAGGPRSGDVIIANHTSYVDVLYLVARYDPVFVEIDNASARVRRISAWAALRAPARRTPALLPAREARPLRDVTEEARLRRLGPVVVFPENATSNGRALLQFLPVLEPAENQDEKSALHIVALKYPFRSFSPAYSVGSQLAHLLRLCAQPYSSLTVRALDPAEAPRIADSAAFCDAGAEPVDLDAAVRDKMVQLSRLRMTRLSAMDKRDFLAFYHERARGYRQPAA